MNTSSSAAGAEIVTVQKMTVTVQKVIVTVVYWMFVDAYVCFFVCMAVYGSSYL